jgi:predicted nucleotidyltransferase
MIAQCETEYIRAVSILTAWCEANSDIQALWLFGSAVSNRMHAASDRDIAALFPYSNIPTQEQRMAMQAELESLFQCDVDFIILNTASPILIRQMLKWGKLLFCRDRKAKDLFIIQSFSLYDDLKMVRKPIEEAIAKRKVL